MSAHTKQTERKQDHNLLVHFIGTLDHFHLHNLHTHKTNGFSCSVQLLVVLSISSPLPTITTIVRIVHICSGFFVHCYFDVQYQINQKPHIQCIHRNGSKLNDNQITTNWSKWPTKKKHNKIIKLNANWMKTRTPKTAIRNRKMTIKYTYNICHWPTSFSSLRKLFNAQIFDESMWRKKDVIKISEFTKVTTANQQKRFDTALTMTEICLLMTVTTH